jgi:hypothetical protein
MQTFLPHSTYKRSAQALDNKRLNKQILEGYQILNVNSGTSKTGGWRNHPAALMWKNHEGSLLDYINEMINEAKVRGINTKGNENNIKTLFNKVGDMWNYDAPAWMHDNLKLLRVITTHRYNLFKKDPLYYARYQVAIYSPYNIPCCSDRKIPCQYYWVTHESRVQ